MIDYSPLWKTMKLRGETWYSMTKKHRIASSTMNRLKHNIPVSMRTINDLCQILSCTIPDICQYIPCEDDQLP